MNQLRHLWIVPLLVAVVGNSAPARAADCSQVVDEFNRAVDGGREAEAQLLTDRIAMDAQCGRFQIAVQRRLAAFRLAAVQFLMARGRPSADYERLPLLPSSRSRDWSTAPGRRACLPPTWHPPMRTAAL